MADAIMAEIKRVLQLKFKWPDEDIPAVEKQIALFTRHVTPQKAVDVIKEDPSDNRVLECAAASGSELPRHWR